MRFVLAVAVIGLTALQVQNWISSRPEAPERINRERSFTVDVVAPDYGTHRADLSTFGQVLAARTLDVRPQVQGKVIEVSPNFIAGGQVADGEVLVRIDPFAYEAAVIEAQAAVADAELALAEAREARALEQGNIEAARASLATAETDLERARALLASGAATQQTVETRALTVAERRQALSQREANLFTLDAQIVRQQAAIARAEHQRDLALRNRANTRIVAPFAGTVTASSASEGAYVNANETIGSLYETAALDVSFMLSDRQYGELSAAGLAGRPVTARWSVGPRSVEARGVVTRTAAEVDAATGGVTVYARLAPDGAGALRPGTFVAVTVEGVAHEQSLLVPETAVYNDDHLYVVRDGRMAAIPVEILARHNDKLIVAAEIPEGEPIITTRLSQAGEGVAVVVEGQEEVRTAPAGPAGGGAGRLGPGGNG